MDLEEILFIHYRVVKDFGGLQGISNEQRLLSAASKLNYSGETTITKAAYFIRDIIQDHPFTDGNKRTAITVAAIFLKRHHFILTCTNKQLEDFAIGVATKKLGINDIKKWLIKYATKPKSE